MDLNKRIIEIQTSMREFMEAGLTVPKQLAELEYVLARAIDAEKSLENAINDSNNWYETLRLLNLPLDVSIGRVRDRIKELKNKQLNG